MKISTKGVWEIAEHEGIVLGPYKDSVGVWTYGIGHTAAAGGLDPAKMKREDTRAWGPTRVDMEIVKILRLFDEDLDKYEGRVAQAVKVPVKQHEFDALVSFDFNTGGIFRADLTKWLNDGHPKAAANAFMGWVKPKEIIKRRKAEQALFLTGNYDGNGDKIPVYDALGDGRLKYRMTVSAAKLSGKMPPTASKPAPGAPLERKGDSEGPSAAQWVIPVAGLLVGGAAWLFDGVKDWIEGVAAAIAAWF